MTFYFSADGSMKYTTNTVAAKGLAGKNSNSSSGSSGKSKFSIEMKNSATSSSGKLSPGEKKALLSNNVDYQRMAKYQKRINEIASRKPRTFDDSENLTMNLSALKSYNAIIEKQAKAQKRG
jgi:hypothetical protein